MKNKKIMIIMIVLISLLFAGYGVLTSLNHAGYDIESIDIYHITSEEDFYHYAEFYDVYKGAILDANITLIHTHELIGEKGRPFDVTFDGQGYCISLEEEASKLPLFDTISSNGVVKNLEVKATNIDVEVSSFGLLAIQNKGEIVNCNFKITNANILVDTIMGGIVAINDGKISFTHIKTKFTNKVSHYRKPSIVAGVCAYNNGFLDMVICNVEFGGFKETSDSEILNGTLNNSIGAIYGINNKKLEDVKECYYLCTEKYYLTDTKYLKDINDLDVAFNENTLLNVFHFKNDLWEMEGQGQEYFMDLKDGVSI